MTAVETAQRAGPKTRLLTETIRNAEPNPTARTRLREILGRNQANASSRVGGLDGPQFHEGVP